MPGTPFITGGGGGRSRRFCLGVTAKNTRRSLKKLLFPLLELVGVHVELPG